jgi:cytochrome P450
MTDSNREPTMAHMHDNDVEQSTSGDPFEDFNRAQGAGSVRDPYPAWAEQRRRAAVVTMPVTALVGEHQAASLGDFEMTVYSAVTYDAVTEILRDSQRFTSGGYAMTMGPVLGRTILEMDPPEHSRYRGLIQQAFTRRELNRWETDLVGPIIDDHIDAFAARGRADLVRELTFPFPVAVIAGMMGLPAADRANFHRWAIELISVSFDEQRGLAGSKKLRDLFARVLEERRSTPQEDLITHLALAELDGERLSDELIYSFLRLLAPAGAETTYRSSSNLLVGLLSNPDQLDALRRDRSLLDAAIDEGVRWECPLTGIIRTATRDTEVCGVPIPAGAFIHVNIGSANHDEARWENAEAFDIHRSHRQNAAFASGAHTCLGMHLAKMETRVLLNRLFDRLPTLRLDPQAHDVHVTGFMFRSPAQLPVVFDPS